jgi:hypothetical protein
MNHEHDNEHEDLIDLGTASIETKGPTAGKEDVQGGFNLIPGLSNE